MSIELRVPEVGESISEVQIGDWACGEGVSVEADQRLVSIETDKVTVEISAPFRGRLAKIVLPKGASARVGDVVALFESDDTAAAESSGSPASRVEVARTVESTVTTAISEAAPLPRTVIETASQSVPWASPAARRALAARGLRAEDVSRISEGRLLKEDVERVGDPHAQHAMDDSGAPRDTRQLEEVVKMSPLRMRVAERLLESQHTAALLTTFNEIDMSRVQRIRQETGAAFIQKHGVKLGLLSFFVRASVEALKAHPIVNAEVRGTDIVYKKHYDIGIAIGGGRGLVVPVLRDVEQLGFSAIEQAIADFASRAKINQLELRELTGGTFTISNGGVYGSMLSTPIVNPPQSAILGLHAIIDRPIAQGGQVVIRPMMYVALTYDHRIIDGREAVSFLRRLKELIENPVRMLLEY